MKIRLNELAVDTLSYLFMVQYIYWVNGSEFPERECCDTILSSPPNPEPVQPTRSTVAFTHIIPSTAINLTTGKWRTIEKKTNQITVDYYHRFCWITFYKIDLLFTDI